MYKSGFVSIIGEPNVGKSTLLNALVGEKLAIVTPKAQTTRQRLRAFLTTDEYQIIFSDTPGIVKPAYKLHEIMLDEIIESLDDADIVLYLTTPYQNVQDENVSKILSKIKSPLIIVINKIDLEKNQNKINLLIEWYKKNYPNSEVITISALHKLNLDVLLKLIVEKLPEHPPYFDSDDLSDRSMRYFVAEIVREKIFVLYKEEIPYCCEVVVTDYKEEENIVKIFVTIYVMRESQKKIIIGKDGSMIKQVGIAARKDIENFIGSKVFLSLNVKVLENWRNNINHLKRLGYIKK
ncbi:MAG: GTPase Era [Bacteroidales bacterium]|nr:GTPase Era [Bacteroidales bacterium]